MLSRHVICGAVLAGTALTALTAVAIGTAKAAEPFTHTGLANSTYPIMHAQQDSARVAGPSGPSRRLASEEIQYAPVGPVNTYAPLISSPYPDGRRVIWVGGYDRIAKVDAQTFEVLSTHSLGHKTFFTESAIERHIVAMDDMAARGDEVGLIKYGVNVWSEPWESTNAVYRFLTKDNEVFVPERMVDGTVAITVYGDENPRDPASKILVKRRWSVPPELSRSTICGLNLTSSGAVVMATMNGTMVGLSPDFSSYSVLQLPAVTDRNKSMKSSKYAAAQEDIYDTFVRNGMDVDDRGGIYVVSRDYLYRVQWTGSKLSLDETDGGWKATYPDETGRGSGTSPALMGWGDGEDHLVVITDGRKKNQAMVFWRDEIPHDWKGLPGMDRRVAGVTPISFGVSKDEPLLIEIGAVVWGYGAYFVQFGTSDFNNHKALVGGESLSEKWLAMSFMFNKPGYQCRGGTKIVWDPKKRHLSTEWKTQAAFSTTIQTVSRENGIIYGYGARDGEWTIEGTDWNTGKSAFHYILGGSRRYDPMGGMLILAPDGSLICGDCGFGLLRVKPKDSLTPDRMVGPPR